MSLKSFWRSQWRLAMVWARVSEKVKNMNLFKFQNFSKISLEICGQPYWSVTPGRTSNKSSARLEWNLSSSEEVSPRKNFLKTTLEAEESENEPSPVKSSPPRNELLEKINFLSSSMTETEQATETDDRQEFANR